PPGVDDPGRTFAAAATRASLPRMDVTHRRLRPPTAAPASASFAALEHPAYPRLVLTENPRQDLHAERVRDDERHDDYHEPEPHVSSVRRRPRYCPGFNTPADCRRRLAIPNRRAPCPRSRRPRRTARCRTPWPHRIRSPCPARTRCPAANR